LVADNLRKGAATNTIQIAEYLYRQNCVINLILASKASVNTILVLLMQNWFIYIFLFA
jgi:hypothetical protein